MKHVQTYKNAGSNSNKSAECFSCGGRPTHQSANGRVLVCGYHLHALPGTDRYVPIDRLSTSGATP